MKTFPCIVAALAVAACSSPDKAPVEPAARERQLVGPSDGHERDNGEMPPRLLRRFKPLAPPELPATQADRAVVALGRMLYFEPRLSRTGSVSCNSCHPLDHYGATADATSTGVDGQKGARNAPSTYNAARHFTQFWDGRARTLEEQASGPMLNPVEMGMESAAKVLSVLRGIPGYAKPFQEAFPGQADPMSLENVVAALSAFEAGLITTGRWDRYLRGDKAALSAPEKRGAKLFANLGCLVCHTGELVGGMMFEKVGAQVPWPNQADRGRGAVTKQAGDDMMFKVPSLRNVARTGPYFHDGSAATLEEAVRMMAHHQLGEDLTPDEVTDIVAWLGALTGDVPTEYVGRPELPTGAAAGGSR